MTYKKPKVVAVISATGAIKHSAQDKGLGVYFEIPSGRYLETVNAYEADE